MSDYEQRLNIYFDLRNTPDSSRESYSRRITAFIKFTQEQGVDIEDIDMYDIQQYILHLKNERGLEPGTINCYNSSIKLFYVNILRQEWDKTIVPRMKTETSIPSILTKQEVQKVLDSVANLKHKAILSMIYGSGLRVGEVVRLRIKHIISDNMTVRVEKAKHGTNRYTVLSKTALETLRQYYKAYLSGTKQAPEDWLFKGRAHGSHISVKTVKNTFIQARKRLQLDTSFSAHTFRHCFATHLLEEGVDLAIIMQLMGHRNISSTSIYLHMTSKSLMGIRSPLDILDVQDGDPV